jgi:hypothetical protein
MYVRRNVHTEGTFVYTSISEKKIHASTYDVQLPARNFQQRGDVQKNVIEVRRALQ